MQDGESLDITTPKPEMTLELLILIAWSRVVLSLIAYMRRKYAHLADQVYR